MPRGRSARLGGRAEGPAGRGASGPTGRAGRRRGGGGARGGPGGGGSARPDRPSRQETRVGELTLRHLSQGFVTRTERTEILRDIDLRIPHGELFCLVGPSGCGKTTLLNTVAGFMPPASGSVDLDGQPLRAPGNDRVVVFQDVHNSLFPWMTVRDNVEFGLKMLGLERAERQRRVAAFLGLVGLSDHGLKFPAELSGGMKQRVQIARALAIEPKVLLMDEPFASLDAQTRRAMQAELLRIWEATRTTILFITHDILEAVMLGDRVGVMSRGPAATVVRIFPLELPRPRSLGDPRFSTTVGQIDALLGQENDHGA